MLGEVLFLFFFFLFILFLDGRGGSYTIRHRGSLFHFVFISLSGSRAIEHIEGSARCRSRHFVRYRRRLHILRSGLIAHRRRIPYFPLRLLFLLDLNRFFLDFYSLPLPLGFHRCLFAVASSKLMIRYQASAGIGKEAADLAMGYLAKNGKVSSKL